MTSTRTLLAAAACLAVPAAATAAPVPLPTGSAVETVDFERHVMGLLSKTGCNLGSCHGSFQGKNGFRLSLFGFEPTFDYAALSRDNLGRRVDRRDPDNSLILLKGAGAVPHDGGMRFGKASWQYAVLREWIAQGATHTPGSGAIAELTVSPPDFAVVPDDTDFQLKVTARFADGSTEDVTPFCDFRVSDDAIAGVSPLGKLTARQPGDAGLSVLYRGTVRALRVLVPAPGGKPFPALPAANFVDREVFAKLKLLNMPPSEQAGDLEFLRRVTIDALGILPTPAEARAFLADTRPDKRAQKIDELLAHPLHAALWATKLSDITGNNTDALELPNNTKPTRSQMWHDWLRTRVAANVPYDVIVRDILTASTADGEAPADWLERQKKLDEALAKNAVGDYPAKKTLDLFWKRQQAVPPEIWGEKVAAAFLGVRLECAQCHKHPTDRWTQEDYWGFANVFAPVVAGFSNPEAKKLIDAENKARKDALQGKNNNQVNTVKELYFATLGTGPGVGGGGKRNLRPVIGTDRVVQPQLVGGTPLPHKDGVDTRLKVWEWMRDPANPFFAKSFVNRVWAHYFGVGLVNPVDDFSQANPPTNPRLLDALAKEFVDSGYDVRKLERTVLTSRTYQLSARPNAGNQFDKNNFARSYVRPLMAEQVVDVLNAAIGVEETFAAAEGAKTGMKMTEVGASRLTNPNLSYVLRIFGRPPRTTACDCERAMEPALPQTLFRMTDPALTAKLRAGTNRASQLAKQKVTPEAAVEELFLAALTRLPTDKEKADAAEFVKAAAGDPAAAYQDVLWALINTREFILNH